MSEPLEPTRVMEWLAAHDAAGRSIDRGAIGDLFSEDAEGRCREYQEWFVSERHP